MCINDGDLRGLCVEEQTVYMSNWLVLRDSAKPSTLFEKTKWRLPWWYALYGRFKPLVNSGSYFSNIFVDLTFI